MGDLAVDLDNESVDYSNADTETKYTGPVTMNVSVGQTITVSQYTEETPLNASELQDGVVMDDGHGNDVEISMETTSEEEPNDDDGLPTDENETTHEVDVDVSNADGVVDGASVTIDGETAETDSEGLVTFESIEDGNHTVSIEIGEKTVEETVDITDDGTVTVDTSEETVDFEEETKAGGGGGSGEGGAGIVFAIILFFTFVVLFVKAAIVAAFIELIS
ncbi:hypothetical protein [Halostagnicola sp. A56]|uniref:hypothetical protein n=1 Tax=Halostagnicola sp. A56 TaxID=1495067 RepID=UPI0006797C0F|nr:hypothetical protein [Halostagnicola sp. A56]